MLRISAVTAALLAGLAWNAHAGFLYIEDRATGDYVFVNDGNTTTPGFDINSDEGTIVYQAPLQFLGETALSENWTNLTITGTTDGSGTYAESHLTVSAKSAGEGSLLVWFFDFYDFGNPDGNYFLEGDALPLLLEGAATVQTGGSWSWGVCADNTDPEDCYLGYSPYTIEGIDGTTSDILFPDFSGTNNQYFLGTFVELTHTTGGTSSVDVNVSNVPTPGTLMLLGAGLLGLGASVRNRRSAA